MSQAVRVGVLTAAKVATASFQEYPGVDAGGLPAAMEARALELLADGGFWGEEPDGTLHARPSSYLDSLAAYVRVHGFPAPVYATEVDGRPHIVDVHHRAWVAVELGVDVPVEWAASLEEAIEEMYERGEYM